MRFASLQMQGHDIDERLRSGFIGELTYGTPTTAAARGYGMIALGVVQVIWGLLRSDLIYASFGALYAFLGGASLSMQHGD